ncbi:hypothetical protein D3C71_1781860 [compost metagenome]
MIGDQALQVQPFNLAVDHSPFAANHYPVRAIGTTQQQRRDRVVAAGETQLIQFEQGQVRLFTHGQFANVGTAQQFR